MVIEELPEGHAASVSLEDLPFIRDEARYCVGRREDRFLLPVSAIHDRRIGRARILRGELQRRRHFVSPATNVDCHRPGGFQPTNLVARTNQRSERSLQSTGTGVTAVRSYIESSVRQDRQRQGQSEKRSSMHRLLQGTPEPTVPLPVAVVG